ncbi:MAG: hypothetical protein Q9216_001220 [Gyalolechia sp. 2 TL-2023]
MMTSESARGTTVALRLREKDERTRCRMPPNDIVDSHIHLYPRNQLQSLAWCHEGHPLHDQYSVEEYLEASRELRNVADQRLRGFVFIETDRKPSSETEAGWEEPLRELDWIKRVADGTPRSGEGHDLQHAHLCLGIVLWAPVPSGSEVMSRYVNRAKDRAGNTWQLVKGFRYLVQDKPPGVMMSNGFIDSLRWMGCNGYTFDLGVDARSGGLWQLSEAVGMIERAHGGVSEENKVVVVINHLCKPDMRSRNLNGNPPSETFREWKREVARLASFSNVYMKISGGFSEMDALPPGVRQGPWDSSVRQELLRDARNWAENWLKETLTVFGPRRVLFGSDWPVCNVGGGGNKVSWMNWWSVVQDFVENSMSGDDQPHFWSGNATRAYSLSS